MKEILAYHIDAGETDGKYRWDADYEEVRFSVYIPKWRVPWPIPLDIMVRLYGESEYRTKIKSVGQSDVLRDPARTRKPIWARIAYNGLHSLTARYDCESSEIGSLYIPHGMLESPIPLSLVISVIWD